MTCRKLVISTLLAIVICEVAALVVFHNEIAIAYHHHRMMRAWTKIREVGPSGKQTPWIDSYERHRDTLVQRGYFDRREFLLSVQFPETHRVWKQIAAEFPNYIHISMRSTEWGWSENKIIVWDRPDRMALWETVIRRYDVPETPTSAKVTTRPAAGGK